MNISEQLENLNVNVENLYECFLDTVKDLENDKGRTLNEFELMWEFYIYAQLFIENAEQL